MTMALISTTFANRLFDLASNRSDLVLDARGDAVSLCNHGHTCFGVLDDRDASDVSNDVTVNLLCPLCARIYDIHIPSSDPALRYEVTDNIIVATTDGMFDVNSPAREDLNRLGLAYAEIRYVIDFLVVFGPIDTTPAIVVVGDQTALVSRTAAKAIDTLRPGTWIREITAWKRGLDMEHRLSLPYPYFIYDSFEKKITMFKPPDRTCRFGLGGLLADGLKCPRCGCYERAQGPGKGPHQAKLICKNCKRFIRWLSSVPTDMSA